MPEPTDPRRHQADTERNLLIGAIVLLLVVGGGLIATIYGRGAGVLGVICLAGGVGILLVLYLLLKLFERIGGE